MPNNSEIEHSSVRDFSDVRQEISMMKTFRKNWSNNIMTNEALIKMLLALFIMTKAFNHKK